MEKNWSILQTRELFSLAGEVAERGEGLNAAFLEMASKTGRSVNSVRNYYYSQLKMFELVPKLADDLKIKLIKNRRKEFELFTSEEINSLLERILTDKAKGKSVRTIINDLSHGNEKLALRLQNKYRSLIAHHRNRVNEVMNKLANEGILFFNPYTKEVVDASDSASNIQKLTDYIKNLDSQRISEFLTLLQNLT